MLPQNFYHIEKDLETLNLELNTQCLSIRRGLQGKQRTGAIYANHPTSTAMESIAFLKDIMESERDADLRERVTRLYYACIDQFIRLDLLIMDEVLDQFLLQAGINLDGERIAFSDMMTWIISQADFNKRERLREKALPVLAKASKMRAGILRQTVGILTDDFGFENYLLYCQGKKGLDLGELALVCRKFLESTDKVYKMEMAPWVEEEMERQFHNLSRYHAIYLMNLKGFEWAFPKDPLMEIIVQSLREMGIDGPVGSRIFIDMEDRKGKSPLSRCVPLRIPEEIHVTVKPIGGLSDYEAVLHEIGHGLHFAFTNPSLPYPYRHLPRSFALTECFAFLFQNLTMEPSWLSMNTSLSYKEIEILLSRKILKHLYFLRRYMGKFLFEVELFSGGKIEDGEIYSKLMELATGFLYEPEAAFLEIDDDLYSADYIKAWIGEAWLRTYLRKNFCEEWFKKKEAGRFLVDIWKEGQRWSLDDLIMKLGGEPLDYLPLERTFLGLIHR